ncbi:unnamed protein product [Trichogramma brassicae]|uniref:Uncharacterized protein n=1 Tax=Trichogramma brassicae TaxID=86971 RepID=A0A6H5IQF9_9HYME|nr:unnamed protein product [Trichogramma brassicae]
MSQRTSETRGKRRNKKDDSPTKLDTPSSDREIPRRYSARIVLQDIYSHIIVYQSVRIFDVQLLPCIACEPSWSISNAEKKFKVRKCAVLHGCERYRKERKLRLRTFPTFSAFLPGSYDPPRTDPYISTRMRAFSTNCACTIQAWRGKAQGRDRYDTSNPTCAIRYR